MDFRRLKYYCHNSLILVTSGDRQILSAIAEVLTSEKYNFITETSGEKAWEIILQKKPAIVIADWAIPDVSGLVLCHRSKSNLEHPELMAIYFVLIVEDSNSQQRQIGLDTGVDEFLNKPIDGSELKARLRTGIRLTALTKSLTWANQRLLAQNDLLDALGLSDSLTKVLSEQTFADVMPKMMQQLKGFGTYKNYSFLSVLIIDIDLFKAIVDSYGKKIGNEAINAIAGRLSHSCMPNSLIYRHGLDEFVCVTPHSDTTSGKQLSLNLLTSIRSHPIAVSSGLLFPLTISIGGVITALDNQNQQIPDISFEELVSLAEQLLFQSQQSGGDRDYLEIFE
ncbi:diguanylate cyclase [Pseudanabaena sp. UWO311]|uniref:GGDEF domain-containing response regulator n=1 Tax=Pseudanabaena sp. UWO311 TaxID=2487337 RepID=UPI00115B957D|nr:diguanylate cyclase [Pseudanabaena sp. UWO311]TYQ26961.1 diguanylate cyclase [Pseudanabaena sp. UWO311]